MDAKTAITLRQKARKNARKGIAGGCPSATQNVNDMRYSCQGYMGVNVADPGVAGGVFPPDPCGGPCGLQGCPPPDGCHPPNGRGGVPTPEPYMGGVFPCNECGPCQFTHCLPCDESCGPQPCPPHGGVPRPAPYMGGQLPYDECGPCQMAHCIGGDVPIAGYAAGPFPPDCDPHTPCYYESTCTPCQGTARRQRWGNQWTQDELGGRLCFRPCPADPCHPEIPPPPPPPPSVPKRPKFKAIPAKPKIVPTPVRPKFVATPTKPKKPKIVAIPIPGKPKVPPSKIPIPPPRIPAVLVARPGVPPPPPPPSRIPQWYTAEMPVCPEGWTWSGTQCVRPEPYKPGVRPFAGRSRRAHSPSNGVGRR